MFILPSQQPPLLDTSKSPVHVAATTYREELMNCKIHKKRLDRSSQADLHRCPLRWHCYLNLKSAMSKLSSPEVLQTQTLQPCPRPQKTRRDFLDNTIPCNPTGFSCCHGRWLSTSCWILLCISSEMSMILAVNFTQCLIQTAPTCNVRFNENLSFELFCLIGKIRILKLDYVNGVPTLRTFLYTAFNFFIL